MFNLDGMKSWIVVLDVQTLSRVMNLCLWHCMSCGFH